MKVFDMMLCDVMSCPVNSTNVTENLTCLSLNQSDFLRKHHSLTHVIRRSGRSSGTPSELSVANSCVDLQLPAWRIPGIHSTRIESILNQSQSSVTTDTLSDQSSVAKLEQPTSPSNAAGTGRTLLESQGFVGKLTFKESYSDVSDKNTSNQNTSNQKSGADRKHPRSTMPARRRASVELFDYKKLFKPQYELQPPKTAPDRSRKNSTMKSPTPYDRLVRGHSTESLATSVSTEVRLLSRGKERTYHFNFIWMVALIRTFPVLQELS